MKLDTTAWFRQDPKVMIALEGQTFPIKDVLKANGFKFERPLTGPLWYKVVDNTNEAIRGATTFLAPYQSLDVTITLSDGQPNY